MRLEVLRKTTQNIAISMKIGMYHNLMVNNVEFERIAPDVVRVSMDFAPSLTGSDDRNEKIDVRRMASECAHIEEVHFNDARTISGLKKWIERYPSARLEVQFIVESARRLVFDATHPASTFDRLHLALKRDE